MTIDEQIEEIEKKIETSNDHWEKRELMDRLAQLWRIKHRKVRK